MRRPLPFLILLLALPAFAQMQGWWNAVEANQVAPPAAATGPSNIYADFVLDYSAPGLAIGTAVTATIATNGSHGAIVGPWVPETGHAPTVLTNLFVWTNAVQTPTPFFCDGSAYNGLQSTNNWRETNANDQYMTFEIPGSNSIISCAMMVKFQAAGGTGTAYNLGGFETGLGIDGPQWIDDPTTPHWCIETTSCAAQTVSTIGLTNTWWYLTGIVKTNLGQTLWFFYTNNAGTWNFVGSISNFWATPGAGGGHNYFDVGREDVHGAVAVSVFDYGLVALNWNNVKFPLGPLPITNAWAPAITSVGTAPGSTTCAVTWTTDQAADSTVNYGTTSGYGSSSTDATKVHSHTINLSGLSTSTTYHYQVVSANGVGLGTATTDATFNTSSGVNNITQVQKFTMGDGNSVATLVKATTNSVTSGNDIVVGATLFGNVTLTAGMLTKTAGTATIGTIALDKANSDGTTTCGIYRMHVTGSGTLTLTFNPGGSFYMLGGGAEFNNFAASPLGTPGSNSGTGTTLTTGSLSTALGIIFAVGANNPNANYTWGGTDTVIYAIGTGGSTATGLIEYKAVSSSPNTLSPNTGTDSEAWNIVWVPYLSN